MVLVVAVPPFFWRTANVVSMDDRKHWKNHSLLASMLVPRSTPASGATSSRKSPSPRGDFRDPERAKKDSGALRLNPFPGMTHMVVWADNVVVAVVVAPLSPGSSVWLCGAKPTGR